MHDDETPAGGPYGERLLPQVIDAYAKSDPDRIYALVLHSADVTQGFRKITMKELASAVNRIAWWIDGEIGHSDNFETLAYMGATDIRYGIFFFAAIKSGYKFLVPSARNSVSGNVSLLTACNCTKVFVTADTAKKIPDLQKNIPDLREFILASLDDLLTGPSEHYSYDKTHAEGVKDPVLICHTSGSTGAPKPIILPNGAFSVIDNQRRLSKLEGRKNMDYSLFDLQGKGFINTFPGFHVGGIVAMTALPIWYDSHVVMVPSNRPANGEIMGQIMSQMPIRGVFTPPTVLEELLDTPEGLKQIAQTDFVMYGGGPLAPLAGDRISEVTSLTSAIGSTEAGIIPARVPTKENWNYFEWHPDYEVDMIHVNGDIYELTVPNPSRLAWIHTCYHTFPEVHVWWTNDHYKRHPTNPNLFTFRGRGDDVIVLSNGEKFQPVTTESTIQGHPSIEGALVVGTGRFQPALVIEPKVYPADAEAFIEEIWPIVQRANQEAAAHGKIFRGKIILTTPDKPFVRAGKGSVIRPKSTALYADEIEALFSDSVGNKELGVLSAEEVQDTAALKASLGFRVRSILPDLPKGAGGDKEDFFAYGLDSVQTIELASGLRALLHPHLNPTDLSTIGAKMIYANSTVNSLAEYISGLLGTTTGIGGNVAAKRVARMRAMLHEYTKGLPEAINGVIQSNGAAHTNCNAHTNGISYANGVTHIDGSGPALRVVLTGSTGSLGTQLLQALLNDPIVSKIVCLNRAEDALQRTQNAFAQRNVKVDLSKAEFHKAEFADARLGLSTEIYDTLRNEADIVIHNAWKVNFNQSLESFQGTYAPSNLFQRGTEIRVAICVSRIGKLFSLQHCLPTRG